MNSLVKLWMWLFPRNCVVFEMEGCMAEIPVEVCRGKLVSVKQQSHLHATVVTIKLRNGQQRIEHINGFVGEGYLLDNGRFASIFADMIACIK
jgi:hypothetical protein